MKLVDDWRDFWQWWSVWGAVVVALLGATLASLPMVRGQLPVALYDWLMFVLSVLVAVIGAAIPVLRVMKQGGGDAAKS